MPSTSPASKARVNRSTRSCSAAEPGAGAGGCRPAPGRCRMAARARLSALVTDSSVVSEHAGRLAGGEAEHVAQDEHGPLPGRQQLQGGDEGQRDRLAGLVPGLRVRARVGQPLEQDVRVGLAARSPRRAGSARGCRQPGESGPSRAAAGRRAARSGSGWWRPGTARSGPRSAPRTRRALPGGQQRVLQRVLGVLHRPQDPVAVHLQFPLVAADELAERLPVPGTCPVDQICCHNASTSPVCLPPSSGTDPARRQNWAAADGRPRVLALS